MPITNKHNLPMPILKAIETIREDYNPGDADFTATELISPPKLNALKKKYRDQIVEDASDLIRSIEGVALHYILERGSKACPGYLGEQRHKAKFGPYWVSAQFDCLWQEGATLTDWKRTTTYKCEKDPATGEYKPNKEWVAQLNIQAEILRRAMGWKIDHLQIGAFLRDWQPTKAMKDELYPQQEIITIPIRVAPSQQIEKYIIERCMLHDAAKKNVVLDGDDSVEACNEEERWQDPSQYAVMKKGGKRSIKNFEDPVAAQDFINRSSDASLLFIESRPSIARRCCGVGGKIYCPVRTWCHHWIAISETYAKQKTESEA